MRFKLAWTGVELRLRLSSRDTFRLDYRHMHDMFARNCRCQNAQRRPGRGCFKQFC
jgi:hypothetical protein